MGDELSGAGGPLTPVQDRYEVHELLGRGGVACVYAATERASQRRVALKQLQSQGDAEKQRRHRALFEREYHTLAQLVHPRIVRVYDFGVDRDGAYYAMELLDGGDLHESAPVPWRQACAIARDIASALSLVHSRRFVHRDVSPRNVRRVGDGTAKLIDFGAMAPMGPCKYLVGTPPCCAPESVHFQSLDGRTDLFALGATLYYTLVGRHAFGARTFAHLNDAWSRGFARPSAVVPDIPAELEALVLDLLRLEPDARPASATEVLERLSIIDGEHAGEQLRAANAYLATPILVGRDVALGRVRRRVTRSTGGRSRSVVIEGASGVGRTRFLDACLLDAALTGQAILRADADDASCGDYGVVRSLSRQFLEQMPSLAREAAEPVRDVLASLVPELADPLYAPASPDLAPRPHLQRALHSWLTSLSKLRPFILAVDDFHRIDEPSAALIALLERDSTEHELCLLITVESGAPWTAEPARKLLQALTTLKLEPLSEDHSEQLLRSVFGSGPHLERLAHRLRELCAGNPRDLLGLAQHLVDRQIVRYAAGAWTLPEAIDASDLPLSMSDALAVRAAALPDAARQLACALALCAEDSFSYDELNVLLGSASPGDGVAVARTLVTAGVLKALGDGMKLSQLSWVPVLRSMLSSEREIALERRLAQLFEQRVDEDFRAGQHWFRAGEPERALDLIVAYARASEQSIRLGPEVFQRYLLRLPSDWRATFQEALRKCDELRRPRLHRYTLLNRVTAMMGLLGTPASELVAELMTQLRHDSGYDDWLELAHETDPQLRLATALQRAEARYAALPNDERVVDVQSAVRDLALAVLSAMGPIAVTLDLVSLRRLPDLMPFVPLSAALRVSQMLVAGVEARCTGCTPRAQRVYRELLELIDAPDGAGLDESHAQYTKLGVMNGLGIIEAGLGLPSARDWAERVAGHPAYEVNATLIRMLDCLFRGDSMGAETNKRSADRLRIQNAGRQFLEGNQLVCEVQAYVMSGDLTRTRQVIEQVTPIAKRFAGWAVVMRYASAEYRRMTRDFEPACSELEAIVTEFAAGEHQIWPLAAQAHVLVLLELGHSSRAFECAASYIKSAASKLDYVPDGLQLAWGLAQAHMGLREASRAIDSVIERLREAGVTGLHLGAAYEARARVALCQRDMGAFAYFAELCRQSYCAYQNPALIAKHHRLLQAGQRNVIAAAPKSEATDAVANTNGRVELALARCRDDDQRARLALTLLVAKSAASAGVLYSLSSDGPVCAAYVGDVADPAKFLPEVRSYLDAQVRASEITSTQSESETSQIADATVDGGRIWRLLLVAHTSDDGELVIAGVVVLAQPERGVFVPPSQTAAAISQFYATSGATTLTLQCD